MTSINNVVQFSQFSARAPHRVGCCTTAEIIKTRREKRQERYAALPPATETARNSRMRMIRRDAWRDAERITRFWRTKMEFDRACEMIEGGPIDVSHYRANGSRDESLRQWREAIVRQLLTPSPDAGCMAWKLRTYAGGEHIYANIDPKRIEQAIAQDSEWLDAHPTRKSIAATRRADS